MKHTTSAPSPTESYKSSSSTTTVRPRQKPGAACEECRRRKLRCDRRQPQCGTCQASGMTCQITRSRSARGPKPGYLKDLRARIAALEGSLSQPLPPALPYYAVSAPSQASASPEEIGSTIECFPTFNSPNAIRLDGLAVCDDSEVYRHDIHYVPSVSASPSMNYQWDPSMVDGTLISPPMSSDSFTNESVMRDSAVVPQMPFGMHFDAYDHPYRRARSNTSSASEGGLGDDIKVSRLMQADLDQLYWDRMHLFAPILHQRHYLTWSRRSDKTEAQKCLQYAMWTLAASVSAGHYQHIRDSLYNYSYRSLQAMDTGDSFAACEIERVQAWLLLAIFEFMCIDFRRGWISAGRAFRLIQLNWLQDIDALNTPLPNGWVETESRRRTFWLAYCLDRLISIRSDSQMTFSEQILIRLPASELDFQNDQPKVTGYLSDVFDSRDSVLVPLSPFLDTIIMATLCGRVLSHRHQSLIDKMHPEGGLDEFWSRHHSLNTKLNTCTGILSSLYPSSMQDADPTLIFVGMMWQTVTLYLYQTLSCVVSPTDSDAVVMDYSRNSTMTAAQEMVRLSGKLSQHNCLKVHPLTSFPLTLCALGDLLEPYPDFAESFKSQLRHITESNVTEAMQGMRRFG